MFSISLIEEGGDWDRRNRLKVYQGIYFLSIRDFKSAANNFLDSISTFTSYELMDYKTFVMYTVLASMIVLERVDLRQKVGYHKSQLLNIKLLASEVVKFNLYFQYYHKIQSPISKTPGISKSKPSWNL